mgnify:CR=1 FL=1
MGKQELSKTDLVALLDCRDTTEAELFRHSRQLRERRSYARPDRDFECMHQRLPLLWDPEIEQPGPALRAER